MVADVVCAAWCGLVLAAPNGWSVFYFIFLLSLCFQGLVRCGRWPCLCGSLLPGMMPCGVAVRVMDGRSWLLAVTVSFPFSGRLLCRLLCGC